MSKWEDRFTNHAALTVLDQVETTLENAREVRNEHHPKDQNALDGIERIAQAVLFIRSRISEADRQLTAANVLQNMHGNLNHVVNELNNYIGNKNVAHLDNANQHVENALAVCTQFIRPVSSSDVGALNEAATSYRRSMGQLAARLKQELVESTADAERLNKELEVTKAEVQQQKARLDGAISQFQKQSGEAQDRARQELDETLDGIREKFTAAEGERSKAHRDKTEAARAEQATIITDMREQQEKAQKVLDAIGSTGMTTGFQKLASQGRKDAIIWQVGSALVVVGFIVIQILLLPGMVQGMNAWQIITFRTIMALPFFVLAGYGAAQAARANRIAEENKRLELRLASMDPFLVNLPEDLQHRIKEAAALQVFRDQMVDGRDVEVQP